MTDERGSHVTNSTSNKIIDEWKRRRAAGAAVRHCANSTDPDVAPSGRLYCKLKLTGTDAMPEMEGLISVGESVEVSNANFDTVVELALVYS